MRKLWLAAVIAIITAFIAVFSVPVFAAEGNYGEFTIFGGPEYMGFRDIETPDGNISIDGITGFTVGAGYHFNPSVGLEFAWSRYNFDQNDLDPKPMTAGTVISIDTDVDYFSLGPTYAIGDKYKLILGAGAYLCHVDMDVSAPGHFVDSDSDSAYGGYVKAGVDIPIISYLSLGANAGYRLGGDATVFDDVKIETGGFFCNALLRLNF